MTIPYSSSCGEDTFYWLGVVVGGSLTLTWIYVRRFFRTLLTSTIHINRDDV